MINGTNTNTVKMIIEGITNSSPVRSLFFSSKDFVFIAFLSSIRHHIPWRFLSKIQAPPHAAGHCSFLTAARRGIWLSYTYAIDILSKDVSSKDVPPEDTLSAAIGLSFQSPHLPRPRLPVHPHFPTESSRKQVRLPVYPLLQSWSAAANTFCSHWPVLQIPQYTDFPSFFHHPQYPFSPEGILFQGFILPVYLWNSTNQRNRKPPLYSYWKKSYTCRLHSPVSLAPWVLSVPVLRRNQFLHS